jgi:hypothetical protein
MSGGRKTSRQGMAVAAAMSGTRHFKSIAVT